MGRDWTKKSQNKTVLPESSKWTGRDTPCQYCGKLCKEKGLARHESSCKKNPVNLNPSTNGHRDLLILAREYVLRASLRYQNWNGTPQGYKARDLILIIDRELHGEERVSDEDRQRWIDAKAKYSKT